MLTSTRQSRTPTRRIRLAQGLATASLTRRHLPEGKAATMARSRSSTARVLLALAAVCVAAQWLLENPEGEEPVLLDPSRDHHKLTTESFAAVKGVLVHRSDVNACLFSCRSSRSAGIRVGGLVPHFKSEGSSPRPSSRLPAPRSLGEL